MREASRSKGTPNSEIVIAPSAMQTRIVPISSLRTPPKPKTVPVEKKPIGPRPITITPMQQPKQKHAPAHSWPPKKKTSYKSYPIWKLYGG